MSDSRKYYYLKLKENFFDSDGMILLENMEDGYVYSNILMKLYLKSLKDDGRLMLNGTIPYNAKMLASVTRHKEETVNKALEIFKELGLIEVLDSGAIYMLDIQNFIGLSSTEADRKREYRQRIESEKSNGNTGMVADMDKCPDISPPEFRDKSIYITPLTPLKDKMDKSHTNEERGADFEKIYKLYPKKAGREQAFKEYCSWLEGRNMYGEVRRLSNKQMWDAVKKYIERQKENETREKYYISFDCLMGQDLWDYVPKEQEQ